MRTTLSGLRTTEVTEISPEDRRTQFAVFAFLLALAVLFHQSRLGDWEVFSPHIVVSLSAIFVLLKPSSLRRFLLMLTVDLVVLTIDLPLVVNHWILLALTTIGLGAGLAVAAMRRAPWLSDPGQVYRRIAPVVRIQVVLVYLFAVLAKLNTDFLDPVLSCGAAMSQDLLGQVPVSLYASWQDGPAIAGTLLIEALVPIGLLLRRARVATIIGGGLFHTVLALAGHVPFSGFAFAFYALFLPDDTSRRLRALMEGSPRLHAVAGRVAGFARSPAAFPVLGGAWVVTAAGFTYGPEAFGTLVARAAVALFVVYALVLAAVLVGCLRQGGPSHYLSHAFRLAHPVWALAPALVVLNALTPYLGLKTQNAFTMYSNLQTEEGAWNHLLLPEAMRVFGLQDDLVRIVSSDDELLARAAASETRLVEHELHTYLADHPRAAVRYEQDGRAFAVAGGEPRAGEPSLAERKLLLFRDVPVQEQNTCRNRRSGPAQGS